MENQCRADVRAFAREVVASVDDVLRVLSLLNRHLVRWTRVVIESTGDSPGPRFTRSVWDRTAAIDDADRSLEPLVNSHRLPVDGLDRLVRTFRSLPEKKAVAASITYLTAVLDAPHLETSLTCAFTALEALVQGLAHADHSDLTIRNSRFDRLATELRAHIHAFGPVNAVADTIIEEMCEKVTEIQRRPIKPVIAEVVARLGAEWGDIWPTKTDLSEALGPAYKRRNRFIHRGEFPPARHAFVDYLRLHALTERMLFRLLGGDVAWQTGREYRHLDRLVRAERETAGDEDGYTDGQG